MKIGVFDSGVGGLSVAQAIEKTMPEQIVVFKNDSEHVPYGTRSPEEVLSFVVPVLQALVEEGCTVIVIACNTVSTTLIHTLRNQFTVPLIAMEPMIKPAAELTKNGVITVCATPATLASERYAWLKQNYAAELAVLEPDCSDWSYMIEHDAIDEAKIRDRLEATLEQGADVIVLGCTHYHWIEDDIRRIAGERATVLQPEQAVIKQLQRVLGRLG